MFVSIPVPFTTMINMVQAQEKGPRSDVRIKFYSNAGEAYGALKNGSIDFLYWPLNSTLLDDAKNDPNLVVVQSTETGMYELDINNNFTIRDYAGVKSPTYETKFRQAMAYAFDKDYILNTTVSDFGARIDQPLHALSGPWLNETYLGDGYPYKYNLTKATQLLAELGFNDTDSNGWLNYPQDWPGAPNADFTEYPLKLYVRNDHIPRLEAGRYLASQLESLGVKCNKTELPKNMSLYLSVMGQMNYHVYTAGWSLTRQPSWLDNLYHGSNWNNPPGDEVLHQNYVTGLNETGLPNYPELDRLLEDINAATTLDEAKDFCKKALGYFVDECINIPLYSTVSYSAYRKAVHGVSSTPLTSWSFIGYNNPIDVLNKYTLVNAYKDNSEPLNVGYPTLPKTLNVLENVNSYDSWPLSTIYDEPTYFQSTDPLGDQPWLANSWNTTTWNDPETGENKTEITFQLRNDSQWIKPVTGESLGQVNASDWNFGTWFMFQAGWGNSIHHIKVTGNYTLEVYLDKLTILLTHTLVRDEFAGLVLPMQAWTNFGQLVELTSSVYVEGVNATTPGYLDLPYQDVGAPVAAISVRANDTELVEYYDFQIERGMLKIMTDLPENTIINATYWAFNYPGGFYPGELPWQDTMVGNGPFYITESDPTVGGQIYLKANPSHFMAPSTFQRDVAVLNVTPAKTSVGRGENLSTVVQVENRGNATENFRVTLYTNTTSIGMQYTYNLPANTIRNLSFNWNTTSSQLGSYQLKAVAETVTDESQTADNTYIGDFVTVTLGPSENRLYINPPETRITLGVDQAIDVLVSDIDDLYGFEVEVRYNTTLLSAVGTLEGPFLQQAGSTMIIFNEINGAEGYVKFAVSLLSVENGASGSGKLLTVSFNSSLSTTGNSSITLSRVKLSDSLNQPIPYQCVNGSVQIVEIETQSYEVIKNATEYEITTVSNSTIRNLEYNASESKISINATGPSGNTGFCNVTIPKNLMNGTFAVLVNNTAVHYESHENETHYMLCFDFSHSNVTIDIILTLKGDLNGDRKVSIYDVVIVASAYDAEPGDPNWNPIADIVEDGTIDIYDAVAVCRQYGKSWQP